MTGKPRGGNRVARQDPSVRPVARKPRWSAPARGGGRWLWLGACLAVLIVLMALIFGSRQTGSTVGARTGAHVSRPSSNVSASIGLQIGDRAPNFTLPDLQGKQVSLNSFLGRPVLLHFWAVDCTTCQGEQPGYLKAIKALGKKAPAILAVDAWGESAGYVAPYVRKAHLPGTVLIDPPHAVFDGLYQGQGTPTSFYIDRQGIIRRTVIGPQSYDQILANAKTIGA